MLRVLLASCMFLAAVSSVLPVASAGPVALVGECFDLPCCGATVQTDCYMCFEWHYHQPAPPMANGEWHCHHAVRCYAYVAGICYCGGPDTICDDVADLRVSG